MICQRGSLFLHSSSSFFLKKNPKRPLENFQQMDWSHPMPQFCIWTLLIKKARIPFQSIITPAEFFKYVVHSLSFRSRGLFPKELHSTRTIKPRGLGCIQRLSIYYYHSSSQQMAFYSKLRATKCREWVHLLRMVEEDIFTRTKIHLRFTHTKKGQNMSKITNKVEMML